MTLAKRNINSVFEKVFLTLAFLLAFSMPFGIYFSKIVSFLWFVSWFLKILFDKFSIYVFIEKDKLFLFGGLFVFLLLHIVGLLFSENMQYAMKNLNIKLYLFLIPLVLVTTSEFTKQYIKSILNFYVLGNLISSLILIIRAFYKSIHFVDGQLVFQAVVNPKNSFFEAVSDYGNYFFYSHFSNFIHPSYAALMVLFSIVILLLQNNIFQQKLNYIDKIMSKKWIAISAILFLTLVVFLLSSKANFIALILLLVTVFLFSKIKYRYVFLVFFMLVSIAFLSRNSRVTVYLKYIVQKEKSTRIKSGTQRFYLWKTGLKLVRENFLFGVGTGDVNDEFSKLTKDEKIKKLNNLHNDFLEAFVRLGILGFLTILFIFIFGFWLAFKNRNFVLFYFFLLTAVNFFFESMLDRVGGTMFFGFFTGILPFVDPYKKSKFELKSFFASFYQIFVFLTSLFFLIFIFNKGIRVDIFEANYTDSIFFINTWLRRIWSEVFYINNLFWLKFFDVFTLVLTVTLIFGDLAKKKNNKLFWLIVILGVLVILSFTDLIFINSLFFLFLFLSIKYIFKYLKSKEKKSNLVVGLVLLLLFINVVFGINYQKTNFFSKNEYSLFNKNEIVKSNNLELLGVKEKSDKLKKFEEIIEYPKSENLKDVSTNVAIFAELLKVEYKTKIENDSSVYILYNSNAEYENVLVKNDDFVVIGKISKND